MVSKKYNNNFQFIIGVVFLLYWLYTFAMAININENVIYALLLIIPIYFQTVFTFLYFLKKYGKPRLQDWMRLAIFFILVLNFMQIVNNNNGLSNFTFVVGTLSLNNSPFVMFVIICTLLAMDIAYIINNIFLYNKIKNKIYAVKKKKQIVFSLKKKQFVFSLLILSVSLKMYLLLNGLIGYGTSNSNTGILSLIAMLSNYLTPFSLIMSAYIIYVENNDNKIYSIIFYTCFTTLIFLGFISGMKERIIEPVLYVIVVYLAAGKKLPKKMIYIGFFVIILLYPINNTYRNIIHDTYLNTGSKIANIALAINHVINKPISETFLSGVKSYGDRTAMFPFLLYAIDNEIYWNYYKYMDRYIYLPISWIIPRILLESKPKADTGAVLYEKVIGERTGTAITVTTIGWAYLEGGLLFVFITFIILGLIFEIVDKKNIKNPINLLFYIILLHFALKPEWDSYFMISSLIQMFIIYFLLLKFIGIRKIINEN